MILYAICFVVGVAVGAAGLLWWELFGGTDA